MIESSNDAGIQIVEPLTETTGNAAFANEEFELNVNVICHLVMKITALSQ